MQLIEIVTILIAVGIVALPIILHIKNRNKKSSCASGCDLCKKNCSARIIEKFRAENEEKGAVKK